jgi:oligopeptide/dipeptide ABC transporter ATP-binding protein
MSTSSLQTKPPLLELRDLSVSFDRQRQLAVDRVNLRIQEGLTLGLVGSSGAGKSSIARAIMRLHDADSGKILFRGEDILRLDPREMKAVRQRIQLVFQDPLASLSPRRSVGQTLLEPLQHFALGDTLSRQEKIRHTLHTVGLDHDVLQRYPHQFSAGQQQRIAIARALVTDPDLLIADEAVASLDVSIQAQILELILDLQKDLGIALLFISHDLAVIRQIADEVAIMYRGQLLEQSSADAFFSGPAHPYSRALLAFASSAEPSRLPDGNWNLEQARSAMEVNASCVFAHKCAEKMPVCEQLEPRSHRIQYRKERAMEPHCVKCHLYDEATGNES